MSTRPTIEILWDEGGEPVPAYQIDLMHERVIFVPGIDLDS